MDDYISRQAALDTLAEQIALCDKALKSFGISMKDEYAVKVERASLIAYKEQLEAILAADVVPVVHGHWEYIDDTYCGFKDTDVRCSVCKTTTNIKRFRKTKWCPDCGAKMDGEG